MFIFAQFWEYTNREIRYNESLIPLEEMSNLSINDLKQYPPQQCPLPSTPRLRPKLTKQNRRYLLRRTLSPAKLRISKRKSTDYMMKFERWFQRKYKKWTEKKGDEYEDEYDTDASDYSTDDGYDDIEEFNLDELVSSDTALSKQKQKQKQKDMSSPLQQQRNINVLKQLDDETTGLLKPKLSKHVVSELLSDQKSKQKGGGGWLRRRFRRKKQKKKDPKAKIRWKGDENKRLKVCVSALMQMRFHNQLAYGGLLSSITLYMRTRLELTSSTTAMIISIWTGLCYITPLLSAYMADAKWGRAKTLIISQFIFLLGMFEIAVSTYFGTEYINITNILFWIGMITIGFGFGGFKPTLSPLGADQFDAKHKTSSAKLIAKQRRSSFFGWLYWANQVGAIFASSVIAYICQNIDFSIGWSLSSIALIFSIASYYTAKNYFICVPPEGSVFGNFMKVTWYSTRAKCKGIKPPTPIIHSYPSTSCVSSMNIKDNDDQNISPFKSPPAPQSIPLINEETDTDGFLDSKQPLINTSGIVYVHQASLDDIDGVHVDDEKVWNTPPNQHITTTQLLSTGSDKDKAPYLHQMSSYYPSGIPSIFDINKQSHGGSFDDFFIEDIKTALSALPALIPFPVAYIIYTNLLTLVYSQGCQMNIHFGNNFAFPISALAIISTVTIIIFVPATEKFLYPFMNKYGKWMTVTPLKKMGCAFSLAIFAMLISGITEIIRKSSFIYRFPLNEMSSPCGSGLPVSDISILWQSPQFFLLGMSRVLINTGAQDFFYTEAPKSMKSTLFSLNYAVDGFGAVMGSVSIILVNSGNNPWITNDLNDGHLEYYFFTIGIIMCILFGFFLIFAKNYTYKEFKKLKRGKTLRGKG